MVPYRIPGRHLDHAMDAIQEARQLDVSSRLARSAADSRRQRVLSKGDAVLVAVHMCGDRMVCRDWRNRPMVEEGSWVTRLGHTARDRLIWGAIALGLVQISLSILQGTLGYSPAIRSYLSQLSLRDHPWLAVVLPHTASIICTIALIGCVMFPQTRVAFRNVVGGPSSPVIKTVLYSAIATLASVLANLWPWEWSRPGAIMGAQLVEIVRAGYVAPLVLYFVVAAIAVPILEELVFRFGVQQLLLKRGWHPPLVVLATSVLFGSLHLGTLNELNTWSIRRSLATCVMSMICGQLALRDGGRISRAIAVHATRNGMEAAILLVGVWRAK